MGLLFGALSPQGFMPVFGPDGLHIALCSGSGNTELTISPDDPRYAAFTAVYGAHKSDDQQNTADNITSAACAFSGFAHVAVFDDAISLPIPLTITAIARALLQRQLAARHKANTPPATGPPAFS